MFRRSEENFGVRCTNDVGYGGTKTFKAILNANPYGDVGVIKSVCIG